MAHKLKIDKTKYEVIKTIRITPDHAKRLKALSVKFELSEINLIRQFIEHGLKELGK